MITSPARFACVAATAMWALAAVSSAQIIQSNTFEGSMRTPTERGCYSVAEPLKFHGSYDHQSSGNCQGICYGLKMAVMGLKDGKECWCGNLLPPKQDQVDNGQCDTACGGTADEDCGGFNVWSVWETGYSLSDIPNADPNQASSTITSSASLPPATETVEVEDPQPSSDDDGGSTNVGGVVAGVVVGITVLTAIVIGAWFLMRRRKRQQQAEALRQHEIVAGFVEGGKKPGTSSSSMNDSRLDPELVRRQSDGSIADNQDFSRRILQVRNPDGY